MKDSVIIDVTSSRMMEFNPLETGDLFSIVPLLNANKEETFSSVRFRISRNFFKKCFLCTTYSVMQLKYIEIEIY